MSLLPGKQCRETGNDGEEVNGSSSSDHILDSSEAGEEQIEHGEGERTHSCGKVTAEGLRSSDEAGAAVNLSEVVLTTSCNTRTVAEHRGSEGENCTQGCCYCTGGCVAKEEVLMA